MSEIQDYSIGQLAKLSGCSVQIIRHYEQGGLLPPAPRTTGNQRRYTQRHLQRLQFIRHSRDLGFPLDAIRTLVRLADEPDQSCAAVDAIAQQHLDEVERRIAQLQALRQELQRMITLCGNEQVASCRIIETLADFSHARCLSRHGATLNQDSNASETAPSQRSRRLRAGSSVAA